MCPTAFGAVSKAIAPWGPSTVDEQSQLSLDRESDAIGMLNVVTHRVELFRDKNWTVQCQADGQRCPACVRGMFGVRAWAACCSSLSSANDRWSGEYLSWLEGRCSHWKPVSHRKLFGSVFGSVMALSRLSWSCGGA